MVSALSPEVRALLAGRSQAEIRTIMRQLIEGLTAYRRAHPTQAVIPTANVKKTRKTTKAGGDLTGPKRSLNAWMGFRCFYLLMLPGLTQKVVSKILTIFWQSDLFGAKWTLLAKAYSVVRGNQLKKDAPLAEFFAICAPMVGVVPPSEYLRLNGWVMGPGHPDAKDGMPKLDRIFIPTVASFSAHIATTNLSVDDLVNHCHAVGYVAARVPSGPSNQGTLNMVSMPTVATTPSSETVTTPPSETATTPSSETATTPSSETAAASNDISEQGHQTSSDATAFAPYWPNGNNEPEFVLPAAGQTVLDQATAHLTAMGSVYPHHHMFAPNSQLIGFDPAAANDVVADDGVWDSFDFDDFVNQ